MISFDQIVIFVCGASGLWLNNDHRPAWRKWGPVIAIIAQPFWIYAAYSAKQWGILASTFLYTAAWMRGIYNGWFRKTVLRS